MSGFYDNEEEDRESYKKTIIVAVCTVSVVLFLFLLIIYKSEQNKRKLYVAQVQNEEVSQEEEEFTFGKSNKISSDYDFWDLFKEDVPKEATADEDIIGTPAVFGDKEIKSDRITEDVPSEKSFETGEPDDGNHIAITDSTGKKTWYAILNIPKNNYQSDCLKTGDNGMLQYSDSTYSSKYTVDVSSMNGIIDWENMKTSGIEHAFLRIAYRDQNTGVMVLDSQFMNNASNAFSHGISYGAYVESLAISDAEAIEESNYAIAALGASAAQVPIVMDVEGFLDSSLRTSSLTNQQRTSIVKAFCDNTRNFNCLPIIHGSKEVLISMLNLEELSSYDFWVSDTGNYSGADNLILTDFPYDYCCWQYSGTGSISGISGAVNLDILFEKK